MYTKISLLPVYITFQKFHICLSETNDNLKTHRHDFIGEDLPSNGKQGGACPSYQNLLPLKVINVKYIQESISFKLTV